MKAIYRASEADALSMFQHASVVRLAAAGPVGGTGPPLLRTLHGVVVDGAICFHGGNHGLKLGFLDQPAIAIAEEVVAEIPSYFVDPELACPATTYYRSAHARGVIRAITEPARKAAVMQALMIRFQPQGGHIPIHHAGAPGVADPRYHKPVASLLVAALIPESMEAKHKLGQNRSRAEIERVLAALWQRGGPGDVAAIRAVRAAHPADPRPAFLDAPAGLRLCCGPDDADARAVADLFTAAQRSGADPSLLAVDHDAVARAHLGSTAWLVARRADGTVAASVRAIGDGVSRAFVFDLIVASDVRADGVAAAVLERMLDHPRLRRCADVRLADTATRAAA